MPLPWYVLVSSSLYLPKAFKSRGWNRLVVPDGKIICSVQQFFCHKNLRKNLWKKSQICWNFSQIFYAKLCVFVMSNSQISSFAKNRSFLINNGVFPPSLMSKDTGTSIQTSSSHDAEDSHTITGFHQITPISLIRLYLECMACENCENPEK